MKRYFAAVLMLCATAAWAGEKFLGELTVVDGGTVSNRTVGCYGAFAGCPTYRLQPFVIPPSSKITIQTDQACAVCTDASGADAGVCLVTTAGMMLPTSTGAARSLTGYQWNGDGGAAVAVTYYGGHVSVSPATVTAGVCTAKVFSRSGTE